ncbi:MAG: UvrD-helicase domain-containing protein [Candidatus Omnitrophica bacterium]|nr:UvrD-helicase domain-containing protein [Candidatus Omnitrophota bacterium]
MNKGSQMGAMKPLMQRLKTELNPPQYEAVTHIGGPLLVLAGAGSGKTRVIAYRMAHLIQDQGLAPWNILAVTFTNKASREMRERVESLIGNSTRGLWIGTFHSICARILRQDGKAVGVDPQFSIYDRADQIAAIKQARIKCGLDSIKKLTPGAVINEISRAKSRFQFPEEYADRVGSEFEQWVSTLYLEYQDALRKNKALDFDDILMQAVLLLTKKPQIGDVYRKRFQHILVDEYQDTNRPQYLLLKELARDHHRICVVGDDDQSIYRWRGADIQNILSFEKDYPEAHTVRLEQNYRSTKRILAAAWHVVSRNSHRHEKKLWTGNEEGEKPGVISLPDEASEAYWVAEQIQKFHEEQSIPFGHFAVFYRVNAQSRLFEEECVHRGLPYSIVGATAFYERKEVKDLLAYARLLINPADRVSFERIVNEPKRKLGKMSVKKLMDFADRAHLPILSAALKADEAGGESGLSPATRKAFHQFARLYERWRTRGEGVSLTVLLDKMLQDSGYLDMLSDSKDPQDEARKENLQELINAAGQFEETMERETSAPQNALIALQGFLENTALISDVDGLTESDDALVLMTVHGAKGLEFPYVFMAGMEEGLFPHQRSLQSDSPEDLEEERRLCYVGITRAKTRIFLSCASSRRLYNMREMTIPSRFISEIPEEYREALSWSAFRSEPSRPENDAGESPPKKMKEESFAEGDMVVHRTFGLGVVLGVEGEGPRAYIKLDFQSAGKKTLVQELARLKKV